MRFPILPGTTRSWSGKAVAVGFFLFGLVSAAPAAPLDELRALTQLPSLDLAALKRGNIVSERGPLGDFARGIHIESVYFIHALMDEVGTGLLRWNPLQHGNTAVSAYRAYELPAAADVFRTLNLESFSPDDQWLIEQTAQAARRGSSAELHLTSEEIALLQQKSNSPSEAWQEILRRRSEALMQGGLPGVPPYSDDKAISPATELRGLLSLAPKAASHFESLTQAKPLLGKGKAAKDAVAYWEAQRVRDHNTLQLGLRTALRGSGSWQLLDCAYYPSDTYFMALDMFQLWPVDGGTLVWQVSYVSAPFRSYLGGADRYVAGKLMSAEVLTTIKAYRAGLEKPH
ncbi:MAG: hypothetical protein ABI540_10050 [Spartobacteria bacterium]